MLKIYMDTCCYNRPFDDLRQEKIGLEEKAIEDIFILSINKNMKVINPVEFIMEVL